MRYKTYTYDTTGRQLIQQLEDYPFFLKDGVFVSHHKGVIGFQQYNGITSKADGIYQATNFNIFFIPESHPFFNIDVITNAVDGYDQPPITSRKLIHNTWVKFTKLTYKYIKKISKAI
jgi:hypothetical protein